MNGPFSSPTRRHPDPVVRAASEWLVSRDRGLTATERDAFEQWLAVDHRHRAVYSEMSQAWDFLAAMPDSSAPDVDRRALILRRLRRQALPLGVAAVLAIAFVIGSRLDSRSPHAETAATEVGGLRQLDLPDGSLVQLNTDSAVDVAYSASERRVRLVRGEAHFTVARNPARPFIVNVASIDVRAVGTAFNIHLRDAVVEVLVTEGRVAVSGTVDGRSLLAPPARSAKVGSTNSVLEAGEKAILPLASIETLSPVAVAPVKPPQVAQLLAWRQRQLQFISQPLSEIVDEFNRYNRHKLTIDDSRLAAKQFGGSFPSDDYTSLVRVLENEFGVRSEQRTNETLLRLPD